MNILIYVSSLLTSNERYHKKIAYKFSFYFLVPSIIICQFVIFVPTPSVTGEP